MDDNNYKICDRLFSSPHMLQSVLSVLSCMHLSGINVILLNIRSIYDNLLTSCHHANKWAEEIKDKNYTQ